MGKSQSGRNAPSWQIVHHILAYRTHSLLHNQSSVSEKRRRDAIDCFQRGMFDVFLLSTRAGGVGVTLTRASRVIIFDPSWNPSSDDQSADRVYRIGQEQEVRIYRLILAGGIEEKMYERQVFKAGLGKTIFSQGKFEERHFDRKELCKVFAQVPDGRCELLQRFEKEGVGKISIGDHRHDLVRAHRSVIGISNHSTIYSQKRKGAFTDAADVVTKKLKQNIEDEHENENTPDVVSLSDMSA